MLSKNDIWYTKTAYSVRRRALYGARIKEEAPMKKRYHSMVRRVVLIPMTVMLIMLLIIINVCVFVVINMQHQIMDSYVSAVRVTFNRIEMRLTQIDTSFVDYWLNDSNHSSLNALSTGTPREEYLNYQTGLINWMKRVLDICPEIEGLGVYYRNLDLMQFNGMANVAIHQFLKEAILNGDSSTRNWQIVNLDGEGYLYTVKNFGNFWASAWISADELMDDFGVDNSFPGYVYFCDAHYNSVIPGTMQKLSPEEYDMDTVRMEDGYYYQRTVSPEKNGIYMGILISRQALMADILTFTKAILVLLLISIALVPIATLWLRHRIARPVSAIDKGMRRIGSGEMDYRIPVPNRSSEDEFDYLISRFNLMMDNLNDLEARLYISKIKQQQTELKYINQQIRPHFILNALNIIYTYDESEFPLMKKMVLYLSEYFRYIVNLKMDFVEAQQELRHVENYLKIQKERYLDRFDFVVEWENQAGSVQIPPLLLQTFVENSVKYGMKSEGKTLICVMAVLEGERLKISVMDTGDGYSEAALASLNAFLETRQPQPTLGVGLQNAIERMDVLYGQNVDVRFYNRPEGGAVTEVYLPLSVPERTEKEV